MPVNHPEKSIQHSEHGKSLKSSMLLFVMQFWTGCELEVLKTLTMQSLTFI
jgi:hypothetical protein